MFLYYTLNFKQQRYNELIRLLQWSSKRGWRRRRVRIYSVNFRERKNWVGRKNLYFHRDRIKYFYGNLKKMQYKHLLKQIKKIKKKSATNNVSRGFLNLLEGRLGTLVYRMHFIETIFQSKQDILHGRVLVDEAIVYYPNYIVPIGSIVSINNKYKRKFFKDLYYNISKKRILGGISYTIEMNYNILCGILWMYFKFKYVYFPTNINIQALGGDLWSYK